MVLVVDVDCPGGAKPCLTAGGVSVANVTCGITDIYTQSGFGDAVLGLQHSAASPKPLFKGATLPQATFAALTSHAVKHGAAPPGLVIMTNWA